MPSSDAEVVDVEDFHAILEGTKKLKELRERCQLLEYENKRFCNQACNLIKGMQTENGQFRTKIYSEENQAMDLARLLGFRNVDEAVHVIRTDKMWSPEGRAQRAEAHTRILRLEDEVAKHIITNRDAHNLITELNEQVQTLNQFIEELNQDVTRIREEREAARQEAENFRKCKPLFKHFNNLGQRRRKKCPVSPKAL
ncbi:hypothetical protein M422DRAFT_270953 [Sphaerobolus stellatus SS14]|uniref:Uncharacterized protein n=1 Tax=Sphaerobolus stellatus (strain SS14) TaxID=990650 RepID=A0A0C9TEW4_SPHS4|nr:hypothetical protein M422DRAFT_270953 [Sphaerobolus stellatus SS14]